MPARTPDHTAAPARGLSARLHTGLCRGEADADVRGYRLTEAASAGTFIEVAYLLLHARLPDQDRLADFRTLLACAAEVPPVIRALTEELPLHVTPGQTLRTVVSLLGEFDAQAGQTGPAALRTQAVDLMARLPLVFAAARFYKNGKSPGANAELSFAADLVRLLTGKTPTEAEEVALEADLILAADPAPSADVFAARLAAARGADLFGVVTAALCNGDGPPGGGSTITDQADVTSAVARCVARVPVWAAHAAEQLEQLEALAGAGGRVDTTVTYDRPPERLFEPLGER